MNCEFGFGKNIASAYIRINNNWTPAFQLEAKIWTDLFEKNRTKLVFDRFVRKNTSQLYFHKNL